MNDFEVVAREIAPLLSGGVGC